MKKILCYIDMMHNGGAQRVMSVLVNSLAKKNYSVILVNDFKDSSGKKEYFIEPTVQRVFLRENNYGNSIKKNLLRIINLRKVIKAERPDVCLAFRGNINFRLIIASIGLKTKKIVSVRNDPAKEYKGSEKIVKWIFKKADGVVFQTQEAMDWFPNKVKEKSCIILNPVDESFFLTKWNNPEKIKIVTTGRLVEQKNHEMLIKAFKKVHEIFPNSELYIYGDDFAAGNISRKDKLEVLLDDLKLTDSVFMPGNISNVMNVLSNSTMFVLSSDYEGMPNALMEAMAVGLPCISTDCPCGGPRTIIKDGENGLLVNVGDYESLAKKMISVLDDKELLISLANNAKKSANDFKTEVIMKQWEEYLSKK